MFYLNAIAYFLDNNTEIHPVLRGYRPEIIDRFPVSGSDQLASIEGSVGAALKEAKQILVDRGVDYFDGVPQVLFTYYCGPMPSERKTALEKFPVWTKRQGLTHIHINNDNVRDFQVSPWHRVMENSITLKDDGSPSMLSCNHISDYLRNYLGFYYGGWWSDVKHMNEQLPDQFLLDITRDFASTGKGVGGFRRYGRPNHPNEYVGDLSSYARRFFHIRYSDVVAKSDVNGQSEFICVGLFVARPGNRVTNTVLNLDNIILTATEPLLAHFPAPYRLCCYDGVAFYPINWAELAGGLMDPISTIVYPEDLYIASSPKNIGGIIDLTTTYTNPRVELATTRGSLVATKKMVIIAIISAILLSAVFIGLWILWLRWLRLFINWLQWRSHRLTESLTESLAK